MRRHSRARPISLTGGIFLSSVLLAALLQAQTPDWPLMHTHTTASSVQRLPEAERATVLRILRPELGPLFQGEAPSVADRAMRSFGAERLTLGGLTVVAVQPTGTDLCGATGNCLFWIVDTLHRRILLRAGPTATYAVEQQSSRGMPLIVTSTNESAGQNEKIRWHFTGNEYEPQSCATVDNADANGAQLSQPKITPHPCSPEGD